MADINHVTVPNGGQAAVAWGARGAPGVSNILFYNTDINNTVWIGQQSTITAAGPGTIPVLPNGTFSASADSVWYAIGSAAGIAPLVVVPNGQAYFLGITAGLGNLVIPAIKSPNYVHNVSGWAIFKDGSAEFNDVEIRGGELIAGLLLAYDGTPEHGNLILSFSGSNTIDPFGNQVDQGLWAYNLAGGGGAALLPGAQPTLFLQPPNTAHAGTAAQVFGFAIGAGTPAEQQGAEFFSGNEVTNTNSSAVLVYSAANDGTIQAQGLLLAAGTTVVQWLAAGFNVLTPLQATAGTAATPTLITTDTWHSLGTIAGSGLTQMQARYRLTPDGECEIDMTFIAAAGGSIAGTYTFTNTLPSQYQFIGNYLRIYPLAFNSTIITATQDSIVAVDGNTAGVPGRVRITIPAEAANVLFSATFRIPLN